MIVVTVVDGCPAAGSAFVLPDAAGSGDDSAFVAALGEVMGRDPKTLSVEGDEVFVFDVLYARLSTSKELPEKLFGGANPNMRAVVSKIKEAEDLLGEAAAR